MQEIKINLLDPHPDNPRLALREDVIAVIQASIRASGFADHHAILVRSEGKRFTILQGHHRVEAAKREGLKVIPAWVRECSDEEAFMELVLGNAQGELTPLERGKHALAATTRYGANGGLSIAKYADQTIRSKPRVVEEVNAYEVYAECTHMRPLDNYFRHLVAIHAAPKEHWGELVDKMVDERWTVTETKEAVKKVQPKKAPPMPPAIRTVLLADWKIASPEEQNTMLNNWKVNGYQSHLNEQKTDFVEWARQSWNPVTGCLHNCPYCYAREIAERIYPEKFEPTLHLDRLVAPYQTPVPVMAQFDPSHRNVFTCSMADLFGQWVPTEWIQEVLKVVRENQQWNFLFLTKFPIRMAEFEYPPNAWLGTSVDLQARVKNAERAMRNVEATVKWMSLEPLLEPLQFEDLSAFQWIVIGGASPTNASTGATPEWKPPREWVFDLTAQALKAGCMVYHKTNLNNDRLKMFPNDPHAIPESKLAPPVFHYLRAKA